MAITYAYGRLVIQQGTSFGAVFAFVNADLETFEDLSHWSATFEIFGPTGTSLYKWDSSEDANVATGLWNPTGNFPYNCYVELPKEITAQMSDWGIGHFDLDLIDPFGHAQYRVHDEIVLEEGTTHV